MHDEECELQKAPHSQYSVYTSHGYKVNPALNIKTDLQQFDDLWEQAQQVIPLTYKVYMLKRAIKLYKGSVFETACDDHWLVGIATAYKLKYISIGNSSIPAGIQSSSSSACITSLRSSCKSSNVELTNT